MSQHLVIPQSTTPVWILRARQSVDRGVLLAFIFGLLSVWAILTSSGIPAGTHLEHVLYNTGDTASALREGRVYSRWSPHLLNGYGAPLPSFTPPAAHYAAGTLTVMLTDDPVTSVRIIFAVTQLTACAAFYAWITRRAGALAGCVAAAFYAFAPVISWSVMQLQGDLNLLIAVSGSVILFWAIDRTLIDHQRSDALLVAGSVGLVLTSDPAVMLGLMPAIGLYTALMFKDQVGFINRITVVIGIAIGTLTTAFFWLPALMESSSINWYLSPIKVTHMPTTLTSLLQPVIDRDSTQISHAPGFLIVICAAAAAMFAVYRRRATRLQVIFLFMSCAYGVAALSSTGDELRWHALLTVSLIIVSSTLFRFINSDKNQFRLCALLTSATIILNAPILRGPEFPVHIEFDDSPLSYIEFQQERHGFPGVPPGDSLPASAQPAAAVSYDLLAGYQSGSVNRLYFSRARNQSVLLASHSHLHRYQVRLFIPDTARILIADFPGWEVYLNSLPLRISEDEFTGTMTTEIPAIADGIITIVLGTSPARLLGWFVSASGIVIAGAYIALRTRRQIGTSTFLVRRLLTGSETGGLLTLMVISTIFALVLITLPQPAKPLDQALNMRTSSGLILTDIQTDQVSAAPGDTVHIESTWTPLISPDINYQTRIQIVDEDSDTIIYQTDTYTPAGLAVKRWVEARPITDHLYIDIPHDLPSGSYQLRLQLLPCAVTCDAAQAVMFYSQQSTTHYTLPVTVVADS